jgi:hypothetical protein
MKKIISGPIMFVNQVSFTVFRQISNTFCISEDSSEVVIVCELDINCSSTVCLLIDFRIWDYWTLKIKPSHSSSTSKTNLTMTWCHMPDNLNPTQNYSHNTSCNLVQQYAFVSVTDTACDPCGWLCHACTGPVL